MSRQGVSKKKLTDNPIIKPPIVLKGVRVHNLKNISVQIPRNKFTVITGVSGSGKSSLAFDTIYAEGQRRYVESLSVYARQFLERMDKPDVDFIQGMSPAIAIEQKTISRNPRSTVATTTEIYDYLRLLYARIGKTICPICNSFVVKDSVQTIIEELKYFELGKYYITAPFPSHKQESIENEINLLRKEGFFRLFINSKIYNVDEEKIPKVDRSEIKILVDRFTLNQDYKIDSRVADSLQIAFEVGNGNLNLFNIEKNIWFSFNQYFECAKDKIRFPEPTPQMFSFNNPIGACQKCQGFGRSVGIDLDLIIPDKLKTLHEGAIQPWTTPGYSDFYEELVSIASEANVRLDIPFKKLTKEELQIVLQGYGKKFIGIFPFFKWLERKNYKIQVRVLLSRYRGYTMCDECHGTRLRSETENIQIGKKKIGEVVAMTINNSQKFFEDLQLSKFDQNVAKRILEEIKKRLNFLVDVGVGYLSLDRLSMTLSGGESQRINLATSIGSSLVGSIYVLDEPSIGLHPVDNERLINILHKLRDLGNTVIVVEHDSDMIKNADFIIDLGPKAGELGGEVVATGSPNEISNSKKSLTGKYLSHKIKIPIPTKRKKPNGKFLKIVEASENNLKQLSIDIPLNLIVCITGVSGSGKSTLVEQVIYANLKKRFGGYKEKAGKVKSIFGTELISNIELVDQSPIGRTPRSNPITYIKVFDEIRNLFASTSIAKRNGYSSGYFSFNVSGGRCDACEGDGYQKIEMQFMADLYLLCDVCKGSRYKKEVLEVFWNNKNVSDILHLTVNEAIEFFGKYRESLKIVKKLNVLQQVGLGYIRLGQSATTLSGGEAQRMKLASFLTLDDGNKTLFIFDEPTTGLHFDDIATLQKCFNQLILKGNSVVIVEHNLDIIKCADYVIDLGPEGGENGGRVVAIGSPEEVAQNKNSYTGKFLNQILIK
ncbi:MAG: excinuclease ABC subunit UvrA [Bacteroidetes bacterium]|nr:excinuclease ABC subunit UvrA [Bacteroidota bacterium]